MINSNIQIACVSVRKMMGNNHKMQWLHFLVEKEIAISYNILEWKIYISQMKSLYGRHMFLSVQMII